MKIVVLTSRFPFPLEKGDKLRMYYQLKELSKKHEVVLISLCQDYPQKEHIAKVDQIVSKQYIIRLSPIRRVFSLFNVLQNKIPFRNAYFYDGSIDKKIKTIVESEAPSHIYCQLIRMAEYVKDLKAPKTLDYMDAFSEGAKKRMDTSSGFISWFYKKEFQYTYHYEKEIFKYFDNGIIISNQDKELLPIHRKEKLHVVGNGIDTSFFKSKEIEKSFDLGFIGNLGYYPNVQAAQFLVNNILPKLSTKKGLLLAGARPTSEVKKLKNKQVIIHNWPEDIRVSYDAVNIFVAPLFKGIGQQNKILESMAMGVPVVTTSMVNNAIGALPNEQILLADTAQEFVEQINRLQNDSKLYALLKESALNFVRQNFSWEKVTQKLLDVIEKPL